MKFEPKTEKQIAEEGLIASGTIADFEVLEAEEKVSKAGNPMLALQLKVWRENGSTSLVRDWIVLDQMWKLRGFCAATGNLAMYDAGEVDPFELKGATGRAKIGVKPASGEYPAANSIAGYVEAKAEKAAAPAPTQRKAAVMADDDSIPFAPEVR